MTDKTLFGYTFEQHKANRELWYEALLSGEYSQCTGSLQDNSGYCCLGVACMVYEKATDNNGLLPRHPDGVLMGGVLENVPSLISVREWLGLRTPAGGIPGFLSLASLNDQGRSFEIIVEKAKKFEEELFYTENAYLEEPSDAN